MAVTKTNYHCPLCNSEMVSFPGSVMRKDGVTLWCESKNCSAAEVFGYGKNLEMAYKVITDKYKKVK